ncbi:MAG: S-adenosylmethionine:tRNA ribosyltransferase-isomerase, partial [bacterium]
MQDSLISAAAPTPTPPLADFVFALPPELIAQQPAERREDARLLVVERRGAGLAHAGVSALPNLLRAGDLLIFNDVRVRPARIYGRSAGGGVIELLLLSEPQPSQWECLARPGKRLRIGAEVRLPDGVVAVVLDRLANGRVVMGFGAVDVPALLERHGEVPLPPYIKRPDGPLPSDRERYQTVFARHDGAVAAPTAGLHFSEPSLAALDAAGIGRAYVTLVVGPATFLPWREDADGGGGLESEWS